MNKDQDLGETIELGVAMVETLGSIPGGSELTNPNARVQMGISDQD